MIWHAPVRVLKWRCQVLLAPVPQLDRGPVYETVSWAFEPPRAHKKAPPPVVLFFLYRRPFPGIPGLVRREAR